MGDIPPPIADYCWEGRLGTTIILLCILYVFMSLRVKAVYGFAYSKMSPRGISGAFVMFATVLCTIYTCMVIWNYTVWYKIRGLYEHSAMVEDEETADQLLVVLRNLIPDNRKEVCFTMRMMLVTVLWLVKGSFVMPYYEFSLQLPRRTRFLLYAITAILLATYIGLWIATGLEIKMSLEFEGFSPAAGARVVLFTPPNTWSTWVVSDEVLAGRHSQVPTYLVVECVVTSLNAATDLLLLILIICIFRHLNLAGGKSHFRAASMLIALSALSIAIAIVRLGIILTGMEHIAVRLAFDSLTEYEAFIAVCAACIPAMRVLARGGGSKLIVGFPENWCAFGSRLSRSMKSVRSVQSLYSVTTTATDHDAEKETCYAAARADLEGTRSPPPAMSEIKSCYLIVSKPNTTVCHGVGMPMGWTEVGMERMG